MSDTLKLARDGDVLIITIDSPPVNAFTANVRDGLAEGMNAFDADPSLKAAVIICEGQTFFAGGDISGWNKGGYDGKTDFDQTMRRMEDSDRPVIAAIHGTALGGGCELAACCHYRVAVPSAVIGLPEIKLGVVPGAGATQRLPRLMNVAATLDLIISGEFMPAPRAHELGFFDRIVPEGELRKAAIAFAHEVADIRPLRRAKDLPVNGSQADVDAFRTISQRKYKGYEAPEVNIRAVEASLTLPFEEGLNVERELFRAIVHTPQARAQQYMFFAQRNASKIDGIAKDIAKRDIKRVGVIGAGTMGGGIAMNFLSKGVPVTIVEMKQEALDRGTRLIRKNYEASAAKGRMKPEQVEAAMNALTPSLAMEDLADCDLIIEAVFENLEVKKGVFAKLDKIAKPGAILATNTSFQNVDQIAAATRRPQDVLGLHFFSPANVMKLLEIVRGKATADDVLATAMQVAKLIGKIAVISGVTFGFIGNRMLMPRQLQAGRLVLEGASPEQIDKVHMDFGMPMGPFAMSDLAGLDILKDSGAAKDDFIGHALVEAGRLGQKSGAGWYDYDEKRNPSSSQVTADIIDKVRKEKGITPRSFTDEEIIERTLYPMVNEGALILEEGIAQRASDIDVVWVFGYGWPVYRGGPMFWAGIEGTKKIVEGLEKHGFTVAKSLKDKAESGAAF